MIIYYQDIGTKRRYQDNIIHASFVRPQEQPAAKQEADIIDLGYFRARKIIRDIESEYLRHYPYFF